MSRSNNTEIVNPASRFFDWKGGDGTLSYWDKVKEERVNVKIPFRFLVLDRVAQVGGGIGRGKDYQGFWSNAVRDTRKEPFVVKSKAGVYAEGLWKDIKDKHTSFITGLYIAFYDDNKELALGYLKLGGAANSAWIEFTNKVQRDIYKGVFTLADKEFDDSGPVHFYKPVFSWSDKVTEETDELAKALDADILQPYLANYFAVTTLAAANGHHAPVSSLSDDAEPEWTGGVEPDDIPF